MKLELVGDHYTSPEIGDAYTRVVMKNQNSYCLATDKKGYVLYEGGKLIDQGHFKADANFFKSMVYVKDVDAYFMVLSYKIYKKEVNGLNPQLWVDGKFGWNSNTPMEYSPKNKRIFTTMPRNTIAVIDPKTNGVEFSLNVAGPDYIMNYRFIGKNHQYVIFASWNGRIGLFKYDTETKTGHVITLIQIPNHYGPSIDNLEVDSTEKVVLVSMLNEKGYQTNMVVYELWNNRFTFKSSVAYTDNFHRIRALSFDKYYQNYATFIGVDTSSQGLIDVVRYNIHTGVLSRETEKVLASGEDYVRDLDRVGEWFYFAGKRGKVFKTRLVDTRKGN